MAKIPLQTPFLFLFDCCKYQKRDSHSFCTNFSFYLRRNIGLFYQYQFQTILSSSSTLIGGADEPTSIYVSNVSPRLIPALITAAAGVAALIGVYCTRRR